MACNMYLETHFSQTSYAVFFYYYKILTIHCVWYWSPSYGRWMRYSRIYVISIRCGAFSMNNCLILLIMDFIHTSTPVSPPERVDRDPFGSSSILNNIDKNIFKNYKFKNIIYICFCENNLIYMLNFISRDLFWL